MPKIDYVGGFLPFFDPLHTIKTFSARFPQDFPQDCLQDFPARFSCISRKNFPQDFPARISRKIFLQDFPAKFFQFPARLFSRKNFLQDFPARISSRKIFPQEFPQDFPARISRKIFPLDPDWLAPHHPIPNAKFPPITALLNRPTYHKRSKVSPPPFP